MCAAASETPMTHARKTPSNESRVSEECAQLQLVRLAHPVERFAGSQRQRDQQALSQTEHQRDGYLADEK